MDPLSRLTVWLTDLSLFSHKAAHDAILVKTTISQNSLQET